LIGVMIPTVQRVIENLKNPGDSLAQRAISGGFWVFLLRIIQQLFSLGRLFILARILSPTDFGLMGVALLTMATLETFSQTGFQTALIQKRENIESYLDSAWTFLVMRGFALFAILYLIAPYAAAFFGAPAAEPIIQIIGISVLLQAFTNIGVLFFQKELEFNKQFLYQFAGTLADFIVAVSAVLILQNVWALVFGLIAGNAVRCVASYVVHPYRPHIALDIAKIKELFGYGRWIFFSSVLIFLLTQGDDILVGRILGATTLGLYQMAYMISNMPATEITHVISQVTFPVYAKIQHSLPKLRDVYLEVLQLTTCLSFPVTVLICTLAPDFTTIFLGEQWIPMVPAMQALTVFGVTRAINATTGPVFQGIGMPKVSTLGSAIQIVVFIAIVYPLTIRWGMVGTSIAVIIPNILFLLYVGKKLVTALELRLTQIVSSVVVPTVGSIAMAGIIVLYKSSVNHAVSISSFLSCIILGTIIYVFFTYKIPQKTFIKLKDII